jgi:hypothetical protein
MTPKTTQGFHQPTESNSPPRGFSETTLHTDRPAPLLHINTSHTAPCHQRNDCGLRIRDY